MFTGRLWDPWRRWFGIAAEDARIDAITPPLRWLCTPIADLAPQDLRDHNWNFLAAGEKFVMRRLLASRDHGHDRELRLPSQPEFGHTAGAIINPGVRQAR
jgi:hypothetical protein